MKHNYLKHAGISLAFASTLVFSCTAYAGNTSSYINGQDPTNNYKQNASYNTNEAGASYEGATYNAGKNHKEQTGTNTSHGYTKGTNNQTNGYESNTKEETYTKASYNTSNQGNTQPSSAERGGHNAGASNQNNNNEASHYGNAQNPNANTQEAQTHWGYKGNEGPESWGAIASDYHLCIDGREQSPINITQASSTGNNTNPVIKAAYNEAPLSIVNNGHTVQVNYTGKSKFEVNGKKYALKQVHFHTPSEHKINGKAAPIEVHFVHQDKQGNLAVVGVFAKQGEENQEIQKIFSNIPSQTGQQETHQNISFSPEAIIPTGSQAFTYNGSLTTPPCSEKVKWVVYQNPIEVSKQQIKTFKKYFDNNARPTQPINNRQVFSNS